ncbi:MAG: COX15/CtaA family protein [Micromonosporaceae bacterium]
MTRRIASSPALVRRLAAATLVGNVVIVVTGGAVRLTDSGLGCPTVPRCTDDSWVATPEMGVHGAIEFGNRIIAFTLGLITLAAVLAALLLRPRRRSLVGLSAAVLAGVAGQGVLGWITVWTGLNPWIVAGHFLLSMAILAAAYAFWRRSREPDGPARAVVPPPLRTLVHVIVAATAVLLVVGTLVTGAGPHAGDPDAGRNGLDLQSVAQAHADLAFLVLGLAVAASLAVRAVAADRPVVRAADLLAAVVLAQGAVGLVQYATGLPEVLVGVHLLGSSLVWLAALHLRHSATRVRIADAPASREPALAGVSPG